MDRVRLEQLLARFGSVRAAVLGDLFLDRWLMVDASLDEPSVETGLPARQVDSIRSSPGAAGTVLNNLSALEVGKAYAVGFAGMDGEGWELLRALKNRGIDTRHVARSAQRMTPAYIKPLFSTGSGPAREGSRLDIRNRTETPRPLQNRLIRSLHAVLGQVDALIVLD